MKTAVLLIPTALITTVLTQSGWPRPEMESPGSLGQLESSQEAIPGPQGAGRWRGPPGPPGGDPERGSQEIAPTGGPRGPPGSHPGEGPQQGGLGESSQKDGPGVDPREDGSEGKGSQGGSTNGKPQRGDPEEGSPWNGLWKQIKSELRHFAGKIGLIVAEKMGLIGKAKGEQATEELKIGGTLSQ
ncbi:hypothetical protein GCK32_019523 [Trichostrongylus colubriformis]|uniref:Uncharacterized protein n=1 Tax=Trichostrongylus colubriformis TaxID=6319 RepID=A0AAN8FBF8_TRICO